MVTNFYYVYCIPATVLSALHEFFSIKESCGAGVCAHLQMRKGRHKEVKQLAQDDTANKWQLGFRPQIVKLWSPYCSSS